MEQALTKDGEETGSPESDGAGNSGVGKAWAAALGVTLATATAVGFAFQPARAGTRTMLFILGGLYLALTVVTVLWLQRRGELRQRLVPRSGDVSIGSLIAAGAYLLAMMFSIYLAQSGTVSEAWLMRIYLQLGAPVFSATYAIGISILLIAALEEIVWRGLVMGLLIDANGAMRGWLGATLLYTVAHLPTVYLLRDPSAGLNPLLLLAAAAFGLLWGFLATRLERLGPSIFAHAVFTWAVVQFPLWRP